MASYVFCRGKNFYYRRRVPEYLSGYDKRAIIKISLGTKDEKEAIRKAAVYSDYIEDYWRSLHRSRGGQEILRGRALIKRAISSWVSSAGTVRG